MTTPAPPRIPPIRALSGTPRLEFDATTPELAKRAARYGQQVTAIPHNQAELLRFLHLKIYQTHQRRRRARWWGGRLMNWALNEGDSLDIRCVGTHLAQILELLDVEPPTNLSRAGQYAIPVEWAQQAYDRLREGMKLPPYRF